MSGHFRSHQPAKKLQQIRTAIFCLFTAILSLGGALIYAVTGSPGQSIAAPPELKTEIQAESLGVPVLIANRRLETGTRIDRSMFATIAYSPDRVPPGSIPDADFDTFAGQYVKNVVHANYPLHQDDLSQQVPFHLLPIPNGFRAISIEADSRELVEGFVVPNSRVDVLWRYTTSGKRERVKTLVPFVKVLSVGSNNRPTEKTAIAGRSTATLLVSIADAQKIELARSGGHLSLVLVGGTDTDGAVNDSGIDASSLFDDDEREEEQPNYVELTNPVTGEKVRMCESGRRFKREACES